MDTNLYVQNIIARIIKNSKIPAEAGKTLTEKIFASQNLTKMASFIAKSYVKKENRAAVFSTIKVPIPAYNAFLKVCSRDEVGILPFYQAESEDYHELRLSRDDKIDVLFLSTQERKIKMLILEAEALSGYLDELSIAIARRFAELNPKNPLYTISPVDPDVYKRMIENIRRLPPELRFTLFPQESAEFDEQLNVSFFTNTQPVFYKTFSGDGKRGPYSIPKLASLMLACALLERPEHSKEYDEVLRENKRIMELINTLNFDGKQMILVSGRLDKLGNFVINTDHEYHLEDIEENELETLYGQSFKGVNDLLIPLTQAEISLSELTNKKVPIKSISFIRDNHIKKEYKPLEKFKELAAKESIIDMINRKREQILAASDDFNGNNLSNLEDYVYATVSELIIREDEDWSKALEDNEITEALEEVLKKTEHYTMHAENRENNYIARSIEDAREKIAKEEKEASKERDDEEPEL